MKISGIYIIECTSNNKIYVGSSRDIPHRWSSHISALNRNKHKSKYLQHSWTKYGASKFVFKILEEVTDPLNLLTREQEWMNRYLASNVEFGFNVNPVAERPPSQAKLTEEEVEVIKLCLLMEVSQQEIGTYFGVAIQTINSIKKGRSWSLVFPDLEFSSKRPSRAKASRSKLTEKNVVDVRSRLAKGEKVASIARSYNVTFTCIKAIKTGLSWKED